MRDLSDDALDAFRSGLLGKRVLIKMMPSNHDPLCLWDDNGDLSYLGDTYIGTPGKFTVEAAQGAMDLSVRTLNITFPGMDQQIFQLLDGVEWHQRPIIVYRLVFPLNRPNFLSVFRDFAGRMDTMPARNEVGNTSTITLSCVSASREFSRNGTRTASDADQRQRDALDAFFSAAASAVATTINWGQNPQQAPKQKSGGFLASLKNLF